LVNEDALVEAGVKLIILYKQSGAYLNTNSKIKIMTWMQVMEIGLTVDDSVIKQKIDK